MLQDKLVYSDGIERWKIFGVLLDQQLWRGKLFVSGHRKEPYLYNMNMGVLKYENKDTGSVDDMYIHIDRRVIVMRNQTL